MLLSFLFALGVASFEFFCIMYNVLWYTNTDIPVMSTIVVESAKGLMVTGSVNRTKNKPDFFGC